MYKKRNLVIAAVLLFSGWSAPTWANLASLPKALKSSLSIQTTVPAWGPMAHDFSCIQNLSRCQIKIALFGLPKALKPQLDQLLLDQPALGPMAHSMFCVRYPRDCEVRRIAFRGGEYEAARIERMVYRAEFVSANAADEQQLVVRAALDDDTLVEDDDLVGLTSQRWQDLAEVNAHVNRSIRPERNTLGLAGEQWLVSPRSGDCNDYAVTKQHELLNRGWPSRTLLLAEVVTDWGEHHLVLVVRTAEGDFVLDSLNQSIRPWSQAGYRWVRVQSPGNPRIWSTVRSVKN